MAFYTLSPIWGAGAQFFDNNGVPLAGGKIYVYFAGTTTPATTYIDPSGLVANTNPIIANAAGRLPNEIWFSTATSYKFVLKTSNDVLLATYDNIPAAPPPPVTNSASSIIYNTGYLVTAGNFTVGATYQIATVGSTNFIAIGASANLTGTVFTATGVGAGNGTAYYTRSVENKLRSFVDVRDFGAVGDGVVDDTIAIQAALTFAGTVNKAVYVPGTAASYKITSTLTMQPKTTLYGDGYGSFINQVSPNISAINSNDACTIRDLRIKVADGANIAFSACVSSINIDSITIKDNFLEPGDLGGCGVYVQNVFQSLIYNNRIYGGKWSSGAGFAATAADILLFSSAPSARHVISGNHCLSNNSQGIFVDALGYDADIIISDNVCVTLDPATCSPSGAWALMPTGGTRRHGIVVGYNSSTVGGPRCIVSNNICRNTRWTGIYKQGSALGAVLITGNLCDLNGYELGNTLSGGIYFVQSGYELITGNTVTNFQNTAIITGSITVVAATLSGQISVVTNNFIQNSNGAGICLTTNSTSVEVSNNSLVANVSYDIVVIANPARTDIAGHTITGNRIFRNINSTAPSIYIDTQSSIKTLSVKNNDIQGFEAATVRDANSGIYIRQIPSFTTPVTEIVGNKIRNFYYGVYGSTYYNGGRMASLIYENNLFQDCSVGFALSSTTNTNTAPLVNNQFVNVTSPVSSPIGFAVGYIVQRLGDTFIRQSTASPTLGSWAVGDRSMNSTPAVGQPKAWVCTVAGTPGTWVSEGNL
jgi:hypothetical protein